jgi:hypothetical protein
MKFTAAESPPNYYLHCGAIGVRVAKAVLTAAGAGAHKQHYSIS